MASHESSPSAGLEVRRSGTRTASPPTGRMLFLGWHDRLEQPSKSSRATTSSSRSAQCAAQHRRQCSLRPVPGPEHLVRLTWYVTDRDEYVARASAGWAAPIAKSSASTSRR